MTLECGAADAVLRVEEPSRCEYTAQLSTPAACQEAQVAALQAELAARQRAALSAAAAGGSKEEHDEL